MVVPDMLKGAVFVSRKTGSSVPSVMGVVPTTPSDSGAGLNLKNQIYMHFTTVLM